MPRTAWLIAAPILLTAAPTLAQPPAPPSTRIQFAPGAASATLKGEIKGYDGHDYVVGARAGQTLKVTLTSKLAYFNVMPKGSDTALFVGSTSGRAYSGVLPKTGDYVIRVYLMRIEARRGTAAPYSLTAAITG